MDIASFSNCIVIFDVDCHKINRNPVLESLYWRFGDIKKTIEKKPLDYGLVGHVQLLKVSEIQNLFIGLAYTHKNSGGDFSYEGFDIICDMANHLSRDNLGSIPIIWKDIGIDCSNFKSEQAKAIAKNWAMRVKIENIWS